MIKLTDRFNREEAKNASELEGHANWSTRTAVGSQPRANALSVQGGRINRSIRTFGDTCVFLICPCWRVSDGLSSLCLVIFLFLKPSNLPSTNHTHTALTNSRLSDMLISAPPKFDTQRPTRRGARQM